jgi:hypothetical protein
MLVGGLQAVFGVLLCERLCLFFCGVYGEKRKIEVYDRSFEDYERTLEEIKSLFFNTIYL